MNVYTGLLMLGGYISNADLAIALGEESANSANKSPEPWPKVPATCLPCRLLGETCQTFTHQDSSETVIS
jgi:hypothetical protein